MLGGVLEPGGDTICVAAGLAPLATPRVVGLPGSLLLSDMVPGARKGLRGGASNGGRTQDRTKSSEQMRQVSNVGPQAGGRQ